MSQIASQMYKKMSAWQMRGISSNEYLSLWASPAIFFVYLHSVFAKSHAIVQHINEKNTIWYAVLGFELMLF